ncbi:LamG domain-containing protein [Actinoallomurus sp. NPDC052308]|uniref:LamG domain-containing protein n=1 Tax=Actinoallomurus sp. NPDC052308 TaxID=3155530 RepID=UPI00343DFD72
MSLESSSPDPREARSAADFVAQLRRLKAWSGLTYRELEKAAGRHGYVLPHSTIASALKRASLPREELVKGLVTACGCSAEAVETWVAVRRVLAVGEHPAALAVAGSSDHGDPTPRPSTAAPSPRPTGTTSTRAGRRRARRPTRAGVLVPVLLALSAVSAASRPVPDEPERPPVRVAVPPLPAAAGWWRFEEPGGPTALDSSGHGVPLRINGDVSRVAAPQGHALSFGGNGHAVADRPVIRTDAPFTITAWVLLEEAGRFGTVVAAHDAGGAPDVVLLDYDSEHQDWALMVPDRANGWANGQETVFSGRRPAVGNWTHLAAVFDPGGRRLCLYVGGVLGACRARTVVARAAGPLDIGRALLKGAPIDGWQGAIDDVRVFDVPLSPRQVRQVAAQRA